MNRSRHVVTSSEAHPTILEVQLQIAQKLTMAANFYINVVADGNIDHTQKSLITPFELALIKYLDSDYGRVLDSSIGARGPK